MAMITRFGDGMIRIDRSILTFNGPWVRVKTRKSFTCRLTDVDKPAGSMAYRPMTNTNTRMHRIDAAHVDKG